MAITAGQAAKYDTRIVRNGWKGVLYQSVTGVWHCHVEIKCPQCTWVHETSIVRETSEACRRRVKGYCETMIKVHSHYCDGSYIAAGDSSSSVVPKTYLERKVEDILTSSTAARYAAKPAKYVTDWRTGDGNDKFSDNFEARIHYRRRDQ